MKLAKYLLLFLCFVPLLLFRDFTPNNELKYLSIADEALRDGHFFAFWNHGAPYADKPPLYLWIVMLGKWLFGTHNMFFLGLFSLIPAFITIHIMDKWVTPFLNGRYRNSIILMMITSGLFVGSAIVLRMDMLMCMFIVLALYTFYKCYTGKENKYDPILLPIYIFLAIFTKGPVGILVPIISIPVFLWWQGKIRTFGHYLGWKQWGILLGLCFIWFGCVYIEGGKPYLNNLLFNQTVNRAVDAFHHKAPFWYYLKTIWYSLAPWILLYLTAIITGIRKKLLNSDIKRFFLVIITTTFVALSIFSGKLDIYMLPIFPFIGYLAALMLPSLSERWLRIMVAIPATILALAFPGYFIALYTIEFPFTPTILYPLSTFVLTTGSICALYFLYRKQLLPAINSMAIGLLTTVFVGSFTIPALNPMIGFKAITTKAEALAHERNIEKYHYFPFRSAENMDAYLGQSVHPLNINEIRERIGKENFILFVRDKERKRNPELHDLTGNTESYLIGGYWIFVFSSNPK